MHLLTLTALLLLAPGRAEEPFPDGVVVEKVRPGSLGDMAGLKPGDLLLTWHRAPNGAADPGAPEQAIRALDLTEVDREQTTRGPVTIRLRRGGETLTLVTPWDFYPLFTGTRPAFPESLLDRYERGRALAGEGKLEEAVAVWRQVAEMAAQMDGGLPPACWTLAQIGSEWAAKDLEASAKAYGEARGCAEKLGPQALAAVLVEQGDVESSPPAFGARMDAYREALEVRREAQLARAADGTILLSLGLLALRRGERGEALRYLREAVATFEDTAPASPMLAGTLVWLSHSLRATADTDGADANLARAAEIAKRSAPEGVTMASVLTAQSGEAISRGDLALAERLARRALEIYQKVSPQKGSTVVAQLNLGNLVQSRGDLDGAEDWYRGALAAAEIIVGAERVRGVLLHNLGTVALERGDYVLAESYVRRALREWSAGEGSLNLEMQTTLGEVLKERGDGDGARAALEQALKTGEQRSVRDGSTARILVDLGGLQRDSGALDAAETSYEQARAILERAPSGTLLARVWHGLGSIQGARGQPEKAAVLFARAVEVLEQQRGRSGSTEEARSLFSSRFYGVYHDCVQVLVTLGRAAEAFRVSEAARARGLLVLMAERDLVLEEAPPELEAQRRQADAEYERARAELSSLKVGSEVAQAERLALKLGEIREKQAEIMDRIRQASPRLAEFRDPRPLDAGQVRAALEPETAFLAYSVGSDSTVLFVFAPGEGTGEVEAVRIPVGSEALRPRIAAWRRFAEMSAPPPAFFAEARALYDLLIRPVEHRLSPAKRLVLSADGPLHQLPFAALRRDGAYLAEWKPLTLVPSATVLALLTRSRPATAGAASVVGFGDPRTPGLPDLPGSREEVAAITSLFPSARGFLGNEATEERVKVMGKSARYVHFAGHVLLDERLPLESALALSPAESQAGRDDGLLHAWEIFERVRLDADLVTLSACHSAAGSEVAGEGILGVTRAFQYAGARSVVASLWRVPDKSTPGFMRSFYGSLKRGVAKDQALRGAQLAAIRAGHHPIRWAGFQLYGDWR